MPPSLRNASIPVYTFHCDEQGQGGGEVVERHFKHLDDAVKEILSYLKMDSIVIE